MIGAVPLRRLWPWLLLEVLGRPWLPGNLASMASVRALRHHLRSLLRRDSPSSMRRGAHTCRLQLLLLLLLLLLQLLHDLCFTSRRPHSIHVLRNLPRLRARGCRLWKPNRWGEQQLECGISRNRNAMICRRAHVPLRLSGGHRLCDRRQSAPRRRRAPKAAGAPPDQTPRPPPHRLRRQCGRPAGLRARPGNTGGRARSGRRRSCRSGGRHGRRLGVYIHGLRRCCLCHDAKLANSPQIREFRRRWRSFLNRLWSDGGAGASRSASVHLFPHF